MDIYIKPIMKDSNEINLYHKFYNNKLFIKMYPDTIKQFFYIPNPFCGDLFKCHCIEVNRLLPVEKYNSIIESEYWNEIISIFTAFGAKSLKIESLYDSSSDKKNKALNISVNVWDLAKSEYKLNLPVYIDINLEVKKEETLLSDKNKFKLDIFNKINWHLKEDFINKLIEDRIKSEKNNISLEYTFDKSYLISKDLNTEIKNMRSFFKHKPELHIHNLRNSNLKKKITAEFFDIPESIKNNRQESIEALHSIIERRKEYINKQKEILDMKLNKEFDENYKFIESITNIIVKLYNKHTISFIFFEHTKWEKLKKELVKEFEENILLNIISENKKEYLETKYIPLIIETLKNSKNEEKENTVYTLIYLLEREIYNKLYIGAKAL
ncbi:MAG: hypothetical protein ACOCV8_04515 [Spirochaetota bacterium]